MRWSICGARSVVAKTDFRDSWHASPRKTGLLRWPRALSPVIGFDGSGLSFHWSKIYETSRDSTGVKYSSWVYSPGSGGTPLSLNTNLTGSRAAIPVGGSYLWKEGLLAVGTLPWNINRVFLKTMIAGWVNIRLFHLSNGYLDPSGHFIPKMNSLGIRL